MTAVASAERRCAQCWQFRPLESFLGPSGRSVQRCALCRERYSGWGTKSLAAKLAGAPPRIDAPDGGHVVFARYSGNAKTGPIPVSMSERGTCPPSCGLYEAGCYAGYGKLGGHWKRVGARGLTWAQFLAEIRALPPATLWRHNEAGDLPGSGADLDWTRLRELVEANRGRRGFTFTHKTEWLTAIKVANLNGFTVNLSADTLQQADELADANAGPVAVLLPADETRAHLRTPGGRRVTVCPAETVGLTCEECQLCSLPERHAIIGFRAHGQFRAHVPELVRLRRKERAS